MKGSLQIHAPQTAQRPLTPTEHTADRCVQNKTKTMRLLLFFSFCLLLSCTKNIEQIEKSIICGKLNELNEHDTHSLRITYSVYGVQKTEYTKIEADGKFRFEINLQHPIDYKLSLDNKWIRLYSEPGDSSYLDISAVYFPDEIEFIGDQQTFNKNLLSYPEVTQNYFRKYYKKADSLSNISAESLLAFVINTKQKNTEFVMKYSKENNWSKKFTEWALNDMNYEITHDLSFYRGPKNESYYNSFYNTFEINNTGAISNYKYWEYLQGYLVYILNFKNELPLDSITLSIIGQHILENSDGASTDYLLALAFIWGTETALFSYDELAEEASDYINLVNSDLIKEYLHSYNAKYAKILNSSNKRGFSAIKLDSTIEKIFHEHHGKVIYGKIWADWCGSCVKSMPEFIKLKEEFENVEFILIAIDSELKKIDRLITHFGITDNSYILNENQSLQLKEIFKVVAVPQYFIIDKNGDILKSNTTPPDSYLTKEMLKSLQ